MARDPRHVLMVADIDLGLPDARRVHVTEIARGLRAAGCEVELVSRGPDPRIDGVRYRAAAGSDSGRIGRLARVNAVAIARAAARRRDARSLYVRYDWGLLPTIVAGRALGYRVVLEVNALTSVDLEPTARLGLMLRAPRARQARGRGRRLALVASLAARDGAPARHARRRLRRARPNASRS